MTFDEWYAEWYARKALQGSDEERILYRQAYLAGYMQCLENVQRFERELAQKNTQRLREEVDYDVF